MEHIKRFGLFLFPLMLLAIVLGIFLTNGPLGVVKAGFPPVEKIGFEQVFFSENEITAFIINEGPDEVTVSQILVNDAYNQFEIKPSNTLKPLDKAVIKIQYPWIFAEPVKITILTKTGVTFDKEIGVPFNSPIISWDLVVSFILIGIYVGVIPIFLGFLWLPFVKTLNERWYHFLLSLTVGLLLFIGFDALLEAFELAENVPGIFQGMMIILIGFVSTFLVLIAISNNERKKAQVKKITSLLTLSYLIALAIGIHNFGEGLAIGSAYSIGELSLGALLVVGFMIHNVTEGIAIVGPLASEVKELKHIIRHMILLGLIAGGPTILGTLIGGFSYSPIIAVLFLSIGAAAALQVVIEVTNHMKKEHIDSLFTITNSIGVIVGLLIMYVTGLIVF